MNKKTLDDYLLFLRKGISMKFDFANNLYNKFSVLRNFVKSKNNIFKWDKNFHPDIEDLISYI